MAGGTVENYGYDYPYATVSVGGTDTSSTTWIVATSAPFPAAGAGPPALQFHVADPALPTETIAVTNVGANGTWTVVRGAENTTAIQHTPGFTIRQVISGYNGVSSFYQLANLGATTATLVTNSTTNTPIASVYVQSNGTQGGANAGAIYEMQAYGTFATHSEVASATATISVFWGGTGGTLLGSIVSGLNGTEFVGTGAALPVYINSLVSFENATQCVAMVQMLWKNATTNNANDAQAISVGTVTTVNGTSGTAAQLCVAWQWKTQETTNIANFWGVGNPIQ